MHLDTLGDELLVGHLTTEVVSVDHVVTLQAVVTCEALHIHDRIDTDRVRIGSRASS